MSARCVARQGSKVRLVRGPLAAAHGAVGWDFPEGEGDTPLGTWAARGDVVREDVQLFAGDSGLGELVEVQELRERWGAGDVVLAPWVGGQLFGGPALGVDAWEVAPAIRMLPLRTPTLPPATHTNAFLVGDGPCVLIEPAPREPSERRLLRRWIEAARGQGLECLALVPTHHHPDHVGALDLAESLGLPVWAHPETAARIEAPVDRLIEGGEVWPLGSIRLEVIHTPGHAPGHLCFFEPASRTAIVGDMVAGVGTILVEPGDGDMRAYLDSLAALRGLGARKLLPAHGGVIADPGACLDHYLRHRAMREGKVTAALAATGGGTVRELLPLVYDDAPRALWPLAEGSLRAHLDKLEGEGRARRDGERWFSLPGDSADRGGSPPSS